MFCGEFLVFFAFFFFNDTATTEIYTLSLHDALPISGVSGFTPFSLASQSTAVCSLPISSTSSSSSPCRPVNTRPSVTLCRSEEHTSELQSRLHPVCRLLLERKSWACSRTPTSDSGPG